MSHVPHELAEEFPDKVEKMHDMKQSNAHFARLADEYHTINREIHRIEAEVEAASDERLTDLRKSRMRLKDEIAGILAA
ncbi:MAG: DUF465 domain-containing protein [Pseudomonadota bacterium]